MNKVVDRMLGMGLSKNRPYAIHNSNGIPTWVTLRDVLVSPKHKATVISPSCVYETESVHSFVSFLN